MSDDLVKRLKRMVPQSPFAPTESFAPHAAADRIEELEAERDNARRVGEEWFEESKKNHGRAVSAEAKLVKAVEALEEIATDEHPLGWAAIAALRELKGEKID